MRLIICNGERQITYENIAKIVNREDNILLVGDLVEIHINGWMIAKASTVEIEKRCLIAVDEVFLDTRIE